MTSHPHFLWADLFKRKSTQKSVANALKENILFRTLNTRELTYLSTLVYERIYQPEESIFSQNDRGLGMYLIIKGRVAIQNQHPHSKVLITYLTEGSFFGEIALVDPNNIRTASAIAAERTAIIGFFKPDLLEILERKPSMGVKILLQLSTVLGKRLLETTEKLSQLDAHLSNPESNEKTS